MLISVRKRFVFVANSKTASTSIEQALSTHAEIMRGGTAQHKHISMRDALREYAFLFDQPDYAPGTFFRFGVMRDPIDWIFSWYRYRRSNKFPNHIPDDVSFEEFWSKKDWNIIRANGKKHLQHDYFTDGTGNNLADYIIPYSQIDSHFEKICDRLNIDSTLPKRNVSKVKDAVPIPDHLTNELKEFYSEDYELMSKIDNINAAGMTKLESISSGLIPEKVN